MPFSAPAAPFGLQKKRKQLPAYPIFPVPYLLPDPPDGCSHRPSLAAHGEKTRSDLVKTGRHLVKTRRHFVATRCRLVATKCLPCIHTPVGTSAGTLLPHTTLRSGRGAYPRHPLPERRRKKYLTSVYRKPPRSMRPVGPTPYGNRYSRNNRPARGSRPPDCSPNSRRPYRSSSSCGRAPGARRTPRPPLHRRLQ